MVDALIFETSSIQILFIRLLLSLLYSLYFGWYKQCRLNTSYSMSSISSENNEEYGETLSVWSDLRSFTSVLMCFNSLGSTLSLCDSKSLEFTSLTFSCSYNFLGDSSSLRRGISCSMKYACPSKLWLLPGHCWRLAHALQH